MISPSTSSTAHARRPSSTTRDTAASVRTTRLSRPSTGSRYASAALTLRPSRRVERNRRRIGRRREQRPVERSELDLGRQRGRDQHPLPRLVDVVPAPRCVDRRIAAQRHHRVDRTRPAEAAAPHVRQRRAARRASGGHGRKRTTGQLDRGEEVPAAERHRCGGIVGWTRLEEDDRSLGILAQSGRHDAPRRTGADDHPRVAHLTIPPSLAVSPRRR